MAVRHHLPLVVSPIIDQLQSNAMLRFNVWLDRHLPLLFTHVGRCAELCRMASMVCLRSLEEKDRLVHGLGVTTACAIAPCPISVESEKPVEGRFVEFARKSFILFLGDAGNPRKNVVRLIKAVNRLDTDLLIGGMISEGKTGKCVRAEAEACPNVHLVGLVSGGEKAFLFEHASVFVLPSLMEGIGLAAAEAAIAGRTVVITKNGGPFDYFADQAYYVNPYCVADIRRKIQEAIDCPIDASRRIRQFSIERTGRDLEDCYQRAIELSAPKGISEK
jgi:glycosyltransferase involved in cell wall biosynthesis